MKTISVTYTYNISRWVSDDICETDCGRFVNVKLGKEIKQFLNGSEKAIYIKGKAVNIKDLKTITKDTVCPF